MILLDRRLMWVAWAHLRRAKLWCSVVWVYYMHFQLVIFSTFPWVYQDISRGYRYPIRIRNRICYNYFLPLGGFPFTLLIASFGPETFFKKFLLESNYFTVLCQFLLHSKVNQLYVCIVKEKVLVTQLYLTLCDSMDCSLPGSSVQSRQPFPSPGDLTNPGIQPGSPALQADSLLSHPPGKPISIYTYGPSFFGFPFHLNFNEFQCIYFFFHCLFFCYHIQEIIANCNAMMFSPKTLVDLALTFKYLIYFELLLEMRSKRRTQFHPLHGDIHQTDTIWWRLSFNHWVVLASL